jgi:hypothetical protein
LALAHQNIPQNRSQSSHFRSSQPTRGRQEDQHQFQHVRGPASLQSACLRSFEIRQPASTEPISEAKPGTSPRSHTPTSTRIAPLRSRAEKPWDAANVSLPTRFTSQRTKPGHRVSASHKATTR